MRYISPEFKTFLNVFSGFDGGSELVTFQSNYDAIYAEAAEGNQDALDVIEIMQKAARVIDLLKN